MYSGENKYVPTKAGFKQVVNGGQDRKKGGPGFDNR